MTNNRLRWGLIGTSDIARTRMIPAMRACGDTVEAVHSSSASRAAEFAAENDIALGTAELQQLLDAEIDAVYISTVNELHFSQTVAALEAGKHVLCEKPLALSLEDAESMIELARSMGLVLATNHHLPGSPLHVAVRGLVEEGRIGTVLSARVAHAVLLPERLRGWRIGADAPGGGVTLDITCHDAAVLNPLLGEPRRVVAFDASQGEWGGGAQDAVMTVIEYSGPNGETVLAQTHDAFTVGYEPTSLSVQGTRGSITVLDAMTQDTAGTVLLVTEEGTEEIPTDTTGDLYEIVLEAFGAAVRGEGSPTATGEDGLAAVRVALAAQQSAQSGRAVDIAFETQEKR
ncbi:MAG: Gfo/Idh/MocA family protein [Leucobacter sp.]